jgi:hypothetical protein
MKKNETPNSFYAFLMLSFALVVISFSNANAQTFLKKYPYSMSGTSMDNKSNTSLLLTKNNDLILSAIKFNMDSSVTFATYSTFFKTDLEGNILFSKTFRNPDDTRVTDIIETNDGNFIITGHSNSLDSIAGNFGFVLMTDSLGIVLWSKGTIDSSGTYGLKVVMINDSICIGTTTYNSPTTGNDIYYYGLNKNGNIQFEKTLSSTGTESGRSLLANHGRVFLLGNTINSFDTVNEFLIAKIDEVGNTLWTYRYHFDSNISYLEGLFISKKNDFTFTVAGSIYNNNALDFFLCEIDTNGNVMNSKIYDFELYDDITSLSSDNNNGYLVNCLTKPLNGPGMFTTISVDSNLNVTNAQKVLSSYYGFGTQGPTIIKNNSSVYLGGIQYDNNPISGTPFIMKLDSNFNSNCSASPTFVNTYNLTVVANPINVFTVGNAVNILHDENIYSTDILFNDSLYCPTITSLNNNKKVDGTAVFPNPNNGELNITLSNFDQEYTVEIIDITGNILMKKNLMSSLNVLNLKFLDNGIYFVTIKNNEGINDTKKIALIK